MPCVRRGAGGGEKESGRLHTAVVDFVTNLMGRSWANRGHLELQISQMDKLRHLERVCSFNYTMSMTSGIFEFRYVRGFDGQSAILLGYPLRAQTSACSGIIRRKVIVSCMTVLLWRTFAVCLVVGSEVGFNTITLFYPPRVSLRVLFLSRGCRIATPRLYLQAVIRLNGASRVRARSRQGSVPCLLGHSNPEETTPSHS